MPKVGWRILNSRSDAERDWGRVQLADLTPHERVATLSPRERQVLLNFMAGKPNKRVAYDLGVSIRTMQIHRSHMIRRLGATSLAEAIGVAVSAGLTG